MLPRVQQPFRPVDRFARRWDQALHQSPLLLGLRLVADGVDVCELAPPLGGGLEAELVDPHVCSELDALVHRHGLVHRPLVCRHGLVVVGGRPQDRTSLGRGDLDAAADGGEGGFSARVHLIEVHEEGEDARALRSPDSRVLVVVPPVELARLVPQDLHRLRVRLRHTRQVGDPASDAAQDRVAAAPVMLAPRSRRGADGLHAVSRDRATPMLLALGDDGARLVGGEEVVVRHHPRVARQDRGRVALLGRLGQRALEHGAGRASRRGGELAREGGVSPAPLVDDHGAPAARPAAPLEHRLGRSLARAGSRLRLALRRVHVVARRRLAEVARHSAVSLHVAGVRVALAHRRPLPAVGRLVDAGQVRHKAAARGRGSCPRRRSAAQLAGVSALHVHVRRVGVALAGLSPAFTALGGVGRAAVGLRRRGSDAKALRIVSGVPARGCALSCRHDFVGVAICSTVRSLPPSLKEQCGAAAPQPLREALLFTLADPVGHDDEGKRPSD
mmetsp:Transcript_34593/g.111591  ORF Transcript_34593/g.111591 Transcript_34593/m.111591 type:complete len:502 (+) Transcript_34593:192-1697(+)